MNIGLKLKINWYNHLNKGIGLEIENNQAAAENYDYRIN